MNTRALLSLAFAFIIPGLHALSAHYPPGRSAEPARDALAIAGLVISCVSVVIAGVVVIFLLTLAASRQLPANH